MGQAILKLIIRHFLDARTAPWVSLETDDTAPRGPVLRAGEAALPVVAAAPSVQSASMRRLCGTHSAETAVDPDPKEPASHCFIGCVRVYARTYSRGRFREKIFRDSNSYLLIPHHSLQLCNFTLF